VHGRDSDSESRRLALMSFEARARWTAFPIPKADKFGVHWQSIRVEVDGEKLVLTGELAGDAKHRDTAYANDDCYNGRRWTRLCPWA
jgi:hypothetical protein